MQADTVYRRGGRTGYAPLPGPGAAEPPDRTVELFPPRFGYDRTPMGILDVLRTNRLYPDARSATSGFGADGYSGTARPAQSWW